MEKMDWTRTAFKLLALSSFLIISQFSYAFQGLNNVVTVSVAGGDFSDIGAAINSITDASDSNRYVILVGPGIYNVRQQIVLKNYIDVRGSGIDRTLLTGRIRGSSDSVVFSSGLSSNGSTISNLSIETIRNLNFPHRAAIECNRGCPAIKNVSIDVELHPLVDGDANGIIISDSSTILNDVNIRSIKFDGRANGLSLSDTFLDLTNSRIIASTRGVDAIDSGINVEDSTIDGREIAVRVSNVAIPSGLRVVQSALRSNLPIEYIQSVEFDVIPPALIRASTLLGLNNVFVEVGGIQGAILCIANDDGRGAQLDNQCNLQ